MTKSASRMLLYAVVSLAVFAFAQPAVNAKDLVTRPFSIAGQISFVPYSDVGVATHFGKFISYSNDSEGSSGWYETANGDLVYWEVLNYDPDTLTVVIGFSGGTGRFEAATGEFTATMVPVDWSTLTFDYEGEGTITY